MNRFLNQNKIKEPSDIEMLARVQKNPQLFSFFYNKYFGKIYKYCFIRLNYNQELTQDAVSDIFLKSVENLDKVSLGKVGEQKSLLPWLYTISRNHIINIYRKKNVKVSIDEEIVENISGKDPEYSDVVDSEITADKIKKCITFLEEEEQAIIFYKINDEMTFAEIADILKKKESAVKMKYYRALEKVTNLYKDTLNTSENE